MNHAYRVKTLIKSRSVYFAIIVCVIVNYCYAQDGDLDSTFGVGGKVTTSFSGGSIDFANDMKIQTDSKIILVGFSNSSGNNDFALARYNSDGSLDTTFGTGGLVLTTFGVSSDDQANALIVQIDGKIIAGGFSNASGNNDFALVRYNTDGSLDVGFGIGGRVLTPFGIGSNDQINDIALQTDGKIVAVGQTVVGGNLNFALARYNSDGSLDNTFGTLGLVTTSFSGSSDDIAFGVTVQTDGKIVVAGRSDSSGITTFAVVRYNSDGLLDTTFGTNGLVVTDFGIGLSGQANSIELQNDGKIVVGGFSPFVGSSNFTLTRYNSDGSLDTSFGTDGLVVTDLGGSGDQIRNIVIQTDDKIIAAGVANPGGSTDFALVRYLPNGTVDDRFGVNGVVFTAFTGSSLSIGVDLQMDGKIIAAGTSNTGGAGDFALAQYLNALTANFNVIWENLIVWLNQNLLLRDSAITFVGQSKIDGKGHTLTLADFSQLLIDANSTLLLENIRIKGIREDSIRCLDNSATVLLKNVEWILDTDFTFDLGKFDVLTSLKVSGANLQFNYQTPMMSTIRAEASLLLDNGLTFNYEPVTTSRDLLELADETSQLILNGATIHSTETGLRLTKGKLIVDQKSFISSDATVKAEGIMFGDGIDAINNLDVIVSPAATLEVINGFLVQADA